MKIQKRHWFIIFPLLLLTLGIETYYYSQVLKIEDVEAVTVGVPNPGHSLAQLECSADSFCVDTTNNRVGIGTANPITKLDISGMGGVLGAYNIDAKGAVIIRTGDTVEDNRIALMLMRNSAQVSATDRKISIVFGQSKWGYNPQHYFGRISGGNTSGDGGHGYLSFHAGSDGNTVTDQMILTYTGNVGIGTASPTVKLQVNGGGLSSVSDYTSTSLFRIVQPYNTNSQYDLYADMKLARWVGDGNYRRYSRLDFNLSNEFAWDSNPEKTVMSIRSDGNVGIGTTSPGKKLELYGTTNDAFIRQNRGGSYYWDIGFTGTSNYQFNSQTGGTIMQLNYNGNVGIGTTSPSYTLTVAGTAWVTSGAWSGSDVRWKKNINTLSTTSSLDQILKLNPVNYEWRTDEFPDMKFTTGTQLGFIAQDMEKIIPEVVTTDNNGYKGISYEKIVPVLTSAMQEQQKEIDQLKEIVCLDHPLIEICK